MYGENENSSLGKEAEIPSIEGEMAKTSFPEKNAHCTHSAVDRQPVFPAGSLLGTLLIALAGLKVFGFSQTFATSCLVVVAGFLVFETGSYASHAGPRLNMW